MTEPDQHAPARENTGSPEPVLSESVKSEVRSLLDRSDGQLALVWEGYKAGEDINTMVRNGRGANYGAVRNRLSVVWALLGERMPAGPTVAAQAGRSVNRLERLQGAGLTEAGRAWVSHVRDRLEAIANDADAVTRETQALESSSEAIEEAVSAQGGVYVYTYPHYRRFPVAAADDSQSAEYDRTLLKLGKTTRTAEIRVREQVRSVTAVPEDPVILRAYLPGDSADDPEDMEGRFELVLRGVGHGRHRSGRSGTEWFLTSLEALDAIAEALGYVRVGDYGD